MHRHRQAQAGACRHRQAQAGTGRHMQAQAGTLPQPICHPSLLRVGSPVFVVFVPMADAVMARLGCARILLAKALGSPRHELVSRTQKDAVLDLLKNNKEALAAMDAEGRAALVTLANSASWYPGHDEEILAFLEKLVPKPKAPRRPMQTFMPSILDYFTDAEWTKMQGAQAPQKMDALLSRLVQLGGRNLSEPCKAKLCSLLMHLQGIGAATQGTKKAFLDMFKSEYKRRARKVPDSLPYLEVLPPPSELKTSHADLYGSIFGSGDPVPSRILSDSECLSGVFCRSNNRKAVELLALADQPQAPRGSPVQMLQDIVAVQQENMRILSASMRPANNLQSLRALAASGTLQGTLPPGAMALPMPMGAVAMPPSIGQMALMDAPRSELGQPSHAQRPGLGEPSQPGLLDAQRPGLGEPSQPGLGAPSGSAGSQGLPEASEESQRSFDSQTTQPADVAALALVVQNQPQSAAMPLGPPSHAQPSLLMGSPATTPSDPSSQQEGQLELASPPHAPPPLQPEMRAPVALDIPGASSMALAPHQPPVAVAPSSAGHLPLALPQGPPMPLAQSILLDFEDMNRERTKARAKAEAKKRAEDRAAAKAAQAADAGVASAKARKTETGKAKARTTEPAAAADVSTADAAGAADAKAAGSGIAKAVARGKAKSAFAKVKAPAEPAPAKAKGKAKAELAPAKAKGKAKAEPKAAEPAAEHEAAEPAPKAAAACGRQGGRSGKRKRLQDESTRCTFRARLADGTSKGFLYTEETKEKVRAEAQAFLNSQPDE